MRSDPPASLTSDGLTGHRSRSIVAPSLAQARIRVGIIGCGLIAQVMHLHYLRELDDRFEIAALCDLSHTVVDQLGDRYGVSRRFTDWTALLEEPLDAVMVLTSGSHEPVAVAAAQAGRHLFIEKPIALSEAEGNAIVAAGQKPGVRIMVGYMKRYDPAVERMAQELPALTPLRFARSTTAEYPLNWYVARYQQEFSFFSPQRRATLVFPSPFLRNAPIELVLEGGSPGSPRSWRTAETVSFESAFKRELVEFYECITKDREPRTTAANAVRDVAFCH